MDPGVVRYRLPQWYRLAGMEQRCLLFVHIPKTGGLTLQAAFRWRHRRFPSRTLRYSALDRPLQEFERVPPDTRANVTVVYGHFYYGLHKHIPRECQYVTILREPVSRVVSLYNYVVRAPEHSLHELVTTSKISLDQYVRDGLSPTQVENGQTRQLAGMWWPGDPDEKTLALAKSNLEGFLAVGLMERFAESVALLWRALGWRFPIYQNRNVTGTPPSPISEEAAALIRERNALDLELYRYAESLFAQMVADQGRGFGRRVRVASVANRLVNAVGSFYTPRRSRLN
jgi:hypothetical protein